MTRSNCFIKVSGDMIDNKSLLDWIKELSKKYFVVLCVGGGTQINKALHEKFGSSGNDFGPLGREIRYLDQKQLARDILEDNQARIQDKLANMKIYICVDIPVVEIGTVLCHVNGDQYTITAYHGFDVLYIVTTTDRVKDKEKDFAPYSKIHVVGF